MTLNLLLNIGITEINIKPKKTINIPTVADEEIVLNKLKEKKIIFIPDFLINAGGIISVYHEQIGDLNSQKVMDMTSNIYDKVTDVLKFSQENDTPTYNAAIQLAKNRIHNISEK